MAHGLARQLATQVPLTHALLRATATVVVPPDVVPLETGTAPSVAAEVAKTRMGLGVAAACALRRATELTLASLRTLAPADVAGRARARLKEGHNAVAPVGCSKREESGPEFPVTDGLAVLAAVLAAA